MCPVCGERPLSIGKPMCLTCWRYVPIPIQTAVQDANRALRNRGTAVSEVALATVIQTAVDAARGRRATLEKLKVHEDLANQLAQAGE